MSTRRTKPWHGEPLKKGPGGMFLCRQCGKECPSARRTTCSKQCRETWLIERSPGFVRAKLRERDKGICAICGLQTREVKDALAVLRDLATNDRHVDFGGRDRICKLWPLLEQIRSVLGISRRVTLWDADHIKAVVDGGGECGLENFQTLCIWCHRAKTAALARRLAEERAAAEGPAHV